MNITGNGNAGRYGYIIIDNAIVANVAKGIDNAVVANTNLSINYSSGCNTVPCTHF
ncbi:hypothetical protein D3C87_1225460 [compost metagenome]